MSNVKVFLAVVDFGMLIWERSFCMVNFGVVYFGLWLYGFVIARLVAMISMC